MEKMNYKKLKFTGHAVRQMFQRSISKEEVANVIEMGESIAEYPDDRPFPSKLLLGFSGEKPLHIVFAYDGVSETGFIVTAYVPDSELWSNDFKRRK